MPAIIAKSISILSDAGLGMAMFSLGQCNTIFSFPYQLTIPGYIEILCYLSLLTNLFRFSYFSLLMFQQSKQTSKGKVSKQFGDDNVVGCPFFFLSLYTNIFFSFFSKFVFMGSGGSDDETSIKKKKIV